MKEIEESIKDINWVDRIAEKLVESYSDKKKFVCAAGITPSGKVHIGNFRDIITSELVCRALKDKGYDAELIFSWDEFDRLRKIPAGIPEDFSRYLGMSLVEIPDPYGCHKSYAKHFESDFEEVMPILGIHPRFIYQSEMYKQNKYYKGIKLALQKRKKIAEILGEFRTQGISEDEIEVLYPLQVYCKKCGKSNTTKIEDYDGENTVKYACQCGNSETIDISKENIGKLNWKIDWPMRWGYEGVSFEPGGTDHATFGGSFYVAQKIAKEVFGVHPPLFQSYAFVGIQGIAKMSSSKGTGLIPKDLLEIYEPELLRWVFCRARPDKTITLFFDSEIIRQYDEFDRTLLDYHGGKLSPAKKREIEFSSITPGKVPKEQTAPFRQVASFGQIVQGNIKELMRMYDRLNESHDKTLLKSRLEKSQNWVNNFMPELKVRLRESSNKEYYNKLTSAEKEQVNRLVNELDSHWSLDDLTYFVYEIPKKPEFSDEERKVAQRNFFRNVYHMLIDADTGPRLSTFLIALGKEKVKNLLDVGR